MQMQFHAFCESGGAGEDASSRERKWAGGGAGRKKMQRTTLREMRRAVRARERGAEGERKNDVANNSCN